MTFGDVSLDYCEALIDRLGDRLVSIKWKKHPIDFNLLARCLMLEELEIRYDSNTFVVDTSRYFRAGSRCFPTTSKEIGCKLLFRQFIASI